MKLTLVFVGVAICCLLQTAVAKKTEEPKNREKRELLDGLLGTVTGLVQGLLGGLLGGPKKDHTKQMLSTKKGIQRFLVNALGTIAKQVPMLTGDTLKQLLPDLMAALLPKVAQMLKDYQIGTKGQNRIIIAGGGPSRGRLIPLDGQGEGQGGLGLGGLGLGGLGLGGLGLGGLGLGGLGAGLGDTLGGLGGTLNGLGGALGGLGGNLGGLNGLLGTLGGSLSSAIQQLLLASQNRAGGALTVPGLTAPGARIVKLPPGFLDELKKFKKGSSEDESGRYNHYPAMPFPSLGYSRWRYPFFPRGFRFPSRYFRGDNDGDFDSPEVGRSAEKRSSEEIVEKTSGEKEKDATE